MASERATADSRQGREGAEGTGRLPNEAATIQTREFHVHLLNKAGTSGTRT